jgi:hypothetical protein
MIEIAFIMPNTMASFEACQSRAGPGLPHADPTIPIEKIVDATGAGDLFAAGFLFGLVRGAGHENAGRLGGPRRGRSDPAHRRPAADLAEGTGDQARVAGLNSSCPGLSRASTSWPNAQFRRGWPGQARP